MYIPTYALGRDNSIRTPAPDAMHARYFEGAVPYQEHLSYDGRKLSGVSSTLSVRQPCAERERAAEGRSPNPLPAVLVITKHHSVGTQ